jgi:hypothetical protein
LGGLLFIDEAYSLVAEGRDDPYGSEAVQAILKRMEDDRHRLAVIIAGYPEPLDRLLATNPGLSSRFTTQMTFDDYRPGELAKIFRSLCEQNQYQVVGAAQARLLFSLAWLHKRRDEHFGNGRLVRNIFEQSIRRLANRIASIAPLTKELLTTFEADDIAVAGVPESVLQFASNKPPRVKLDCPKCENTFVAQWGEPVEGD